MRSVASCTGKVRFSTWVDANRVVRKDRTRGSKGLEDKRQPYHCRACGGVHLGRVDPLFARANRRPRVFVVDEEYAL
jgi:hypothetical protein